MNMNKKSTATGLEIAVIGMAGRFPGAPDIDAYWENLKNGVESITFFSDQELLDAGVDEERIKDPHYVKSNRKLEDKEYFDADFFGYLPAEARLMDPQVRIFHECVWGALEDAGYNPFTYPGLIGLYAGAQSNFHWEAFAMMAADDGSVDEMTASRLRNRDYLTSSLSYKINLKGPAVFIQTSCSTSLVAVHIACRGLLTGESKIALAGGVRIDCSPRQGYLYSEGSVLSTDGHCRAFDAKADGTAAGEGAGVVVLKRLKNALADNDHIYAVIKGSAINNDGVRKIGFTAPSVDGQAEVVGLAQKMARIEPRSVGYVETHGTGTVLGDPIEIEALTLAFGKSREKYCALGSVKTNIGHLDAAAGVAGFIKAVLALKHRQIPPSLHFKTPNPKIDFDTGPFYVNTRLRDWEKPEGSAFPRRAGVSSLGIGGTNAHVILEEAPEREPSSTPPEHQLLLFSAKTSGALERMTRRLGSFFRDNPGINLADAAYTLQTGREVFGHRKALVCRESGEAGDMLLSKDSTAVKSFSTPSVTPPVVFMFPGQGSQYVYMARGLYEEEPVFRDTMDRCFDILSGLGAGDLKNMLYPGTASFDVGAVNQTNLAQPLIFMVEYALAQLLMSWGTVPAAAIGHSIGEYTAACLNGVFSLENALELVVKRGQLMQQQPGGSMVGVPLSREEIKPLLEEYPDLSLAAVNAPRLCVLSGPNERIEKISRQLEQQGHRVTALHTSHAFHSAMMEPVTAPFVDAVKEVYSRAGAPGKEDPKIPFISNLTGRPATDEEPADPAYWGRHIRGTVRFGDGLQYLLKEYPAAVFIEVGPGKTLGTFLRRRLEVNPVPDHSRGPVTVNLLRHPNEKTPDRAHLLEKLGELWLYGVTPDWNRFHGEQRRYRVPLPTYPFEKTPYPVEADVLSLLSRMFKDGKVPPAPGAMKEISQETAAGVGEQQQRPQVTTPYAAPETPVEKQLTALWQDFFGTGKLGVLDDFFQLGGDSLKAMTLSARVRSALEVEITVADFFANPTIRALAQHVENSAQPAAGALPEPVEEKEYYPLSSAQTGVFLRNQLNENSTLYNMPQVFRLEGEIDVPRLESTFQQVIRRHESLRTSFHLLEGQPVQRIHPEVPFSIEYQPGAPGGSRLWLESFIRPFDLSQVPPARVGLFKEAEGKHVLVMDIHHIVTDGMSTGILINDFLQLLAGKQPPPLKTRYRDFARRGEQMEVSGQLEKQKQYWLEHFKPPLPPPEMPMDFPCPPPEKRSYEGESLFFNLEPDLVRRVKELVREREVTLYIFLLALFNLLVSRYTGREDVIVGTAAAGRPHPDLEGLVGLFAGALAMRNRPSKEKTFARFLEEVKQNSLDAFDNQDYSFDALVGALDLQRTSRANPLFNTAFQVQNMETGRREVGGLSSALSVSPYLDQGSELARYDISVYVSEAPDIIGMSMIYAKELFKPETARKLADHYLEIAAQVVENMDIKLEDITLSSDLEELDSDLLQQDDGDFNF